MSRLSLPFKGETSCKGKVIPGFPQGGVLAPLLWNLVVDELLEEIEMCNVMGYADDLMLIVRDPFLDTLMEITLRTLQIVETWSTKIGLSVNPKKTVIIVFTRCCK